MSNKELKVGDLVRFREGDFFSSLGIGIVREEVDFEDPLGEFEFSDYQWYSISFKGIRLVLSSEMVEKIS